MKKRLMILGASILQLPAILKAKEKGLEVIAVDRDDNAIGFKHADICLNISTIDTPEIVKAAHYYKIDGIMTLASDMPMRAVASTASQLDLPGISIQTAENATDKGKMIKAFKYHGVASPWYYVVGNDDELKEINERILYPCIIKPVDNAGSRGVILVNCKERLKEAYVYSRNQSRNGEVIIEEYMQGDEVSVETMTIDGETHVLAITDKLTTGAPYFVEMGHSQQTRLTIEAQEQIKALTISAINAVGIDIGPAHVEIMVTRDGPKIIELGARMGGDCITTHLVPLSTGIDMVGATIDLLTGEKPDLQQRYNKGSSIRFFKSNNGMIKSISGVNYAKKIDGVKEITFTKNIGDMAVNIHSSNDRIGFVISQGKDGEDAIQICEEAMSMIGIDIE